MTIDGKKISQNLLAEVKEQIGQLKFKPKLIDVSVGADAVTESYVRIKEKRAMEVGIDFEEIMLPENSTQEQVEAKIEELNKTENLCGLIVQLPLPKHLNKQAILDKIDPSLDVDIITSTNLGRLFTGNIPFMPATAGAIIKILEAENISLEGKKVLVIGAGDLVGKPVTFLLLQRLATVTIANRLTKNLKELCLAAEIIVSGAGSPKLITSDMVRPETIIIDAGTAESEGSISGDADFDNLKDIVAKITPVPGGVGPMTVAVLLNNVLISAQSRGNIVS